ncbi:MAG: protein kinase [Anaerolineae bacterium]
MVKYSSLLNQRIDRYTLLEKIGSGGMATVFRARDENLDRDVAVKILHKHLADEEGFYGRFVQEARAIASLNHPNIVQVYDFNRVEHEGQTLTYMVMRYVADQTLENILKYHQANKQMIPIERVQRIMLDLCTALEYAHSKGMIHRDLKPSNVLVEQNDHAVLTDFGIVKLAGSSNSHTQDGTIVGTPAYMSPEQATGETLDGRSDLYALGVILFEMLTGHTPYEGDDTLSVLLKHIQMPIPSLSEYIRVNNDAYDRIIMKALAKDPAARYQTAEEFASDLRTFLTTEREMTLVLPTAKADVITPTTSDSASKPTTTNPNRTILQTIESAVLQPARQNPLAFTALAVAVVALLIVARLTQERTSVVDTPPSPVSVQEVVSSMTSEEVFGFITFTEGERFNTAWQQNSAGVVQRVIRDGQYIITNTLRDTATTSLFNPDYYRYRDVQITMDATLTEDSAPSSAYGIVFRYQDPDNYNVFAVDGEARFSLWTRENGIWRELRDAGENWTLIDAALPRGQQNKLTIIVFRNLLVGYINSQLVVRLQEDTFSEGAIGIYTASPATGTSTVMVDSFLIARGENPAFSMTENIGGMRRPTATPHPQPTTEPTEQSPTPESTPESQ